MGDRFRFWFPLAWFPLRDYPTVDHAFQVTDLLMAVLIVVLKSLLK